jgi:hypothetical protein
MLKSENCSAERVAKHLGVDRRTVNRRLASEGQSYSSILDAVRTDMVRNLVENGQRPLNEIAGMLAERIFPLVQEPVWTECIAMADGKSARCAPELRLSLILLRVSVLLRNCLFSRAAYQVLSLFLAPFSTSTDT